jgi:hypothetical protein
VSKSGNQILLILVHNVQDLRGEITNLIKEVKEQIPACWAIIDALFILPDGPGSTFIHLIG